MKRLFIYVSLILLGASCQTQNLLKTQEIQLAEPRVAVDQIFFSEATQVQMELGIAKVALHYQWSEQQGIYQDPLRLAKDFELKVVAVHPQYRSSDTVQVQGFCMDTALPYQILRLEPTAAESYPGRGPQSLQDHIKGQKNFTAGDWLGFYDQKIEIDLLLPKTLSKINCLLSTLIDQASWIFAPAAVRLYTSADGVDYQLVYQEQIASERAQSSAFYFKEIRLYQNVGPYLRIELEALKQLPDWHSGKGHPAWLFIDEIRLTE